MRRRAREQYSCGRDSDLRHRRGRLNPSYFVRVCACARAPIYWRAVVVNDRAELSKGGISQFKNRHNECVHLHFAGSKVKHRP